MLISLFLFFIVGVAICLFICLIWMAVQIFFPPPDHYQLISITPAPVSQGAVAKEQVAAPKTQTPSPVAQTVFFPVQSDAPAKQFQGVQRQIDNQGGPFVGKAQKRRPNAPCWICGRPPGQCTGH